MIENLGFAGLSLGDQGLIQHIKNILADALKFSFDLLTILADDRNILLRALGFFLLFDRRDYTPGSTTGSDNVLVGNREKVALVDSKFTANLQGGLE